MGQPVGRGSPYPPGRGQPDPGTPRPPVPRQRAPYRPAPQPGAGPPRSRPIETQPQTQTRAVRGSRLLIVAGSLLMALSLVALGLTRGWIGSGLRGFAAGPAGGAAGSASTSTGSGSAGPAGSDPAAASGSAVPSAAVPSGIAPSAAVPQNGTGTFGFAGGPGPVLGTAGNVRRFRVAVENGIGQDPTAFATAAEQILGDQRSWIAGGDVRFQRVAQASQFEFTLYLASPGTTDKLCSVGGVHTAQFASCRLPGQVVINLARWLTSVPDYGAPLAAYQQYAINHEVGRELGHVNEVCPAPGVLAPVMQQQSQGLKGCVANAWPYINGQLYAGAALP